MLVRSQCEGAAVRPLAQSSHAVEPSTPAVKLGLVRLDS